MKEVQLKTKLRSPIHKSAPEFIDQSTDTEVLVTGIKVVDLLAPYSKGGKNWSFWRCRSRKNCSNHGVN